MRRVRRGLSAATLAIAAVVSLALGTGGPAQAATGATAPAAAIRATGPGVSADPAAYAAASASPDWVKTPDGLQYKSCVHRIPDGGTVDKGDIVLASGVRQKVPACKYPRLVRKAPASPATSAPTTNGWMITTWWNSPTWLRRLYVDYAVPTAPSVNGALDYFFSSFQSSDPGVIIQPVLAYGANPAGGGNYWTITSWYVWNNNGNSYHGSAVRVSPGDTIWGAMEGNTCNANGGGCHWAIRTRDLTTGVEDRIDINSASVYNTVQGGVLESYGAYHCTMLPANGHGVFRNIQVFGPTFNQLTPSFYVWQPDPECGMYETFSSTSADILWTP